MATKASLLTAETILRAESYAGIQAGIARLENVLQCPSYRAAAGSPTRRNNQKAAITDSWPARAKTVLVLALHHPEQDPRLDYWERGDTWGNRRLKEISEELKYWLRWTYQLLAHPLPYQKQKGGVFLKDAAVMAGIGIIGRNNLLVHPKWGPRIRLRALLLEGEFQTTGPIEGFSPCLTCGVNCQQACPRDAFPHGKYNRPQCNEQMAADMKNRIPAGEIDTNGKHALVVSHCRACEMACPVGS